MHAIRARLAPRTRGARGAGYQEAENDDDRAAEAADWVPPEALSFGVTELASRAVIALARERGESPYAMARALLGLPGD